MPELPHTITRPTDLEALAASLAEHEAIGLDTEFMRERTYRAELCLLQASAPGHAACIDPLALGSLAPVAELLREARPLKVLHAARQDLEVLEPVFGPVAPVFDTQVAAALAGFPAQIGYAELVRQLLDVTLEKAHTRADWSRRPLRPEQIEYALDDVRHLLPLREVLLERLERLHRTAWLDEELASLAAARTFPPDPEEAHLRVKGLQALGPERQDLARRMAAWRERRAIERNRPRGWILDDSALREILIRLPRTPAGLEAIPELPAAFVKHSGAEILDLIQAAGLPDPAPPLPRRERPDAAQLARLKRLSGIVQTIAQELSLSAEVLATRRDLEQLAEGTGSPRLLRGWRGELLGARLRQAL